MFELKKKVNKKVQKLWVCPDLDITYMYGHFINHSDTPNCEVDAYSGVITTKHEIDKDEEITINYGKDYDFTW